MVLVYCMVYLKKPKIKMHAEFTICNDVVFEFCKNIDFGEMSMFVEELEIISYSFETVNE